MERRRSPSRTLWHLWLHLSRDESEETRGDSETTEVPPPQDILTSCGSTGGSHCLSGSTLFILTGWWKAQHLLWAGFHRKRRRGEVYSKTNGGWNINCGGKRREEKPPSDSVWFTLNCATEFYIYVSKLWRSCFSIKSDQRLSPTWQLIDSGDRCLFSVSHCNS